MKQEALKALIEDLRLNHEYCPKEIILQAADELERLAQPQQEPCDMGEMCLGCSPRRADGSCPDAKPWVGLTDEEIMHRIDTHIGVPSPKYPLDNSDLISFARAIEHESKGKNT